MDRCKGKGGLTVFLRRILQPDAVEVEPLDGAVSGIARDHGAVADAVAVAVPRLIGVRVHVAVFLLLILRAAVVDFLVLFRLLLLLLLLCRG